MAFSIYKGFGIVGEQEGWSLTILLPQTVNRSGAAPIFPPETRYGRPYFTNILLIVVTIFHIQPANIRHAMPSE